MKWEIRDSPGGSMGPHALLYQDGKPIGHLYDLSDDTLELIEAAPMLLKYYQYHIDEYDRPELNHLLK